MCEVNEENSEDALDAICVWLCIIRRINGTTYVWVCYVFNVRVHYDRVSIQEKYVICISSAQVVHKNLYHNDLTEMILH